MLVLREPMRVALALITSMMSLGAIYGLLGVHFIAAFQVLIYVGAVMVFMVYVIMLLQVREGPESRRYSELLVPGLVGGALLTGALAVGFSRPATPRRRSYRRPSRSDSRSFPPIFCSSIGWRSS